MSREKLLVDGAALEEEICDDIRKGAQARNFEVMRHGRARFQDILRAKESIKVFMKRGDNACVWGYCAGRALWNVLNGRHGSGKWGVSRGEGISISVGLAAFCLGVAACWSGSPRRQSILRRRVVP